jgi:nitroimidazol reductase NimA-like FMN-containing flavoprotein (pyridoxamine 5'-phosphate oxidase superfamily)
MRRHDREVNNPTDILAIIESADSCCLGLVDDFGPLPVPYVIALNFGYEPAGEDGLRGTFWFHGAREGRKLELIRRNPYACIQLDCEHRPVKNALGCGWGMKYASVLATGQARIVEQVAERRHGLDCLMDHYRRLWGLPDAVEPTGMDPIMATGSALTYEDELLAITTVFRVDVEGMSAKRKS